MTRSACQSQTLWIRFQLQAALPAMWVQPNQKQNHTSENVGSCSPLTVGPLDLEPCFTSEHIDRMEFQRFAVILMFSSSLHQIYWVLPARMGAGALTICVSTGRLCLRGHCQGPGEASAPPRLLRRCLCDSVFPSWEVAGDLLT